VRSWLLSKQQVGRALTHREPGDGQVSFEEFAKLMVSLASAPPPPPGAPLHGQGQPYGSAVLPGAPLHQGLGAPPPHLAGMGQPGGMMQSTFGVGQGMMMGGQPMGMFASTPAAVYGTGNPVQVRLQSRQKWDSAADAHAATTGHGDVPAHEWLGCECAEARPPEISGH
jgi:hypothetical protein